jgi:catechol 2,3-dioxygenase-like lactoylglutathione lyase family enzyme
MLHHVSVGVTNVERAAKFYDAALGALGYKRVMEFLPYAIAYGETRPEFWVQLPHNQSAATAGNGTHVGFIAKSKGAVMKFHAAALEQGGSNNGEPGPRADYGPAYFGAFVYDLDGNKLEATLYSAPIGKAEKPKPKPKAKSAKRPAKKAKKPAKKAAAKKKKKARRR